MRKYIQMLSWLRLRNRHQMYAVLLLALFSLSSIYAILKYNEFGKTYPDRHATREQVQKLLTASIIEDKGIGCQFPDLDPFAEEMMRFNAEIPKVKCEGVDWVECEGSKCTMKREILNKMRDVICIYKDIIYKDDQNYVIGNSVKVHNGGTYHLNRSDHVKVSCTERSLPGLGIISHRWHGYKVGLRPVQIADSKPTPETINVMILCFDSTSHNGFRRRMPHSFKTLTEELGATVLSGYNIVGDGTPAAIIPLLSGKTDLELPEARIGFAKDKLFDPEDFIFKKVGKYGYRTAYYEDMPWIGTFQYRYNGFKSQPADHYIRHFLLEESKNGKKWWNGINRRHCVGSVLQHGLLLNLSKQLLDMDRKHFCVTFIVNISHEDFNLISMADDDVVAFLRHLKDSKKLHDHLVIVMGDHGPRFSALRETYQGKIEERLPLMSIILPDILKKNRPEALINLNNNSKLLTTPFDIYTTIVDVMGLGELINNYSIPGSNLPRGLSLLEPIPKTRTCGQAGVLPHWCVCAKWQNVSAIDPIYFKVVDALVDFINDLTMEVRSQCWERQLTSVEWVMRQSTNDDLLKFRKGKDADGMHHEYVPAAIKSQPSSEIYQAKIVMSPGRAVFEGSMKYNVKQRKFVISERDISRITAYGDEPKCISAKYPHLDKYCFCKGLRNKIKIV